jgi:hypothetical protein
VLSPSSVAHLVPLNIPCPPNLVESIAPNYKGASRHIAFYWVPGGDEVVFDDGRSSGTGNWRSYLTFVEHPKIAPTLARWQFGNSDREPIHWLLLDRADQKFYSGTARNVHQFLNQQHPPAPRLSAEEYEALLKQLTSAMIRHQAIAQLIQQNSLTPVQDWSSLEAQQLAALQQWLDKAPP